MTQEELNALVERGTTAVAGIGTSLDSIETAINAEAEQVAAAFAAGTLDASAVETLVTNLENIATRVGTESGKVADIFTPSNTTPDNQ